jgi:hypothetical protein
VTNSLGSFIQQQISLLGWSRAALATRTGIDEWTLEGILESPVLPEWPTPDEMLALSRALCVSVREIVLRSAEGAGLSVMGGFNEDDAMLLTSNDQLMREVRRRLALGARTGQYLSSPPAQHWGADTGAQSA